jgi:hypothetical protein
MKKIILTAIVILFSNPSFCQDNVVLNTFKNAYGKWDLVEKKYKFEDYEYSIIKFTFKEDYITVDDQSHSIYRIIENYPIKKSEGSELLSAKCYDEANRECLFYIISNSKKKESCIMICYEKSAFLYIVDTR